MSQTESLYKLLLDCQEHRTDEILEKVYGNDHLGIARIGARIHDIKNKFGVEIKSWKDPVNKTLWWYQLSHRKTSIVKPIEEPKAKIEVFGENTCACGGVLIEKYSFGVKFMECYSCKSKKAA